MEKMKKEFKKDHVLSLRFRNEVIWLWPVGMDICRLIGDYKWAKVYRGGLIIPRTEYQKDGVVKTIYNYYPDIYSALRSRDHIVEKEKETVEKLGRAQIDTEVLNQFLGLWSILNSSEKMAMQKRVGDILAQLPKNPRAEKKVEAREKLTAAMDFRDSLGRLNVSSSRARLVSTSVKLEKSQDVILTSIITVNLLRSYILEKRIKAIAQIFRNLKSGLTANLNSWVGFKSKNEVDKKQIASFIKYLTELKQQLLKVLLLPHLTKATEFRVRIDEVIKLIEKRDMDSVKHKLSEILVETEMILAIDEGEKERREK